jgi:hypothetical protein
VRVEHGGVNCAMTLAAQPDHVALVVVAARFERLHVMRDLGRASCTAATDAITSEHAVA